MSLLWRNDGRRLGGCVRKLTLHWSPPNPSIHLRQTNATMRAQQKWSNRNRRSVLIISNLCSKKYKILLNLRFSSLLFKIIYFVIFFSTTRIDNLSYIKQWPVYLTRTRQKRDTRDHRSDFNFDPPNCCDRTANPKQLNWNNGRCCQTKGLPVSTYSSTAREWWKRICTMFNFKDKVMVQRGFNLFKRHFTERTASDHSGEEIHIY